ncbi:MAG TPA: class II fructose-bisphosphate aldolase, partial [Sulfurovum sp.]|nr:class II fructose-bisphosphate aldolase [Sulfurovum sp.]
SQKFIEEKYQTDTKPVDFVFHGGSGSELADIREAISYGAIKMNIDTDTQWAYWDGVRQYTNVHQDYLQGQIGNPEGEEKPNKSHYDPRKWVRSAEESMVERLEKAFDDLNCVGRN